MTSPKYHLRNRNNQTSSIQLRLHIGGKRHDYNIGASIITALWDTATQRPTTSRTAIAKHTNSHPNLYAEIDAVKERIKEIDTIIGDLEREAIRARKSLVWPEIKTALDQFIKAPHVNAKAKEKTIIHFFDDYTAKFVSEIETGERTYLTSNGAKKRYTETSTRSYKTFLKTFIQWQKENKQRPRMNDMTTNWYEYYVDSLRDQDRATNYIGKKIKEIKKILNAAYEEGHHTNTDYKKKAFKKISEVKQAIYLTVEELERLYNLDTYERPSDKIVKDLFLVSAFTALRWVDVVNLDPSDFKEDDGKHYLIKFNKKTGSKTYVPVHPIALAIAKEYNLAIPEISNQYCNQRIKEIAKAAKIDDLVTLKKNEKGLTTYIKKPKYELVGMHTGRRSAATNMYLAEIDTLTIMAATGHKDEKTLMTYVKATGEDLAKRAVKNKYFDYKPKMKVVK